MTTKAPRRATPMSAEVPVNRALHLEKYPDLRPYFVQELRNQV